MNYETTEDQLYELFYQFGEIEMLRIANGREHRSLGWGTIVYRDAY